MVALIIVLVIVVLLILFIVSSYNSLVKLRNKVRDQWAQIEVVLKRRADLIPNLVNTVKGYVSHEKEVINSITTSREKLLGATTVEEKANANEELTKALNNLFVIVENYPDLKSNTNFIQLQDEIAGTENRIAVARKDYNESVKDYNKTIKSFPKNLIANMFGFEEKEYFEAKETSNDVPEVSFE